MTEDCPSSVQRSVLHERVEHIGTDVIVVVRIDFNMDRSDDRSGGTAATTATDTTTDVVAAVYLDLRLGS